MTSASKLFDTRRLRLGRNSDEFAFGSDLASPPPVDRTTHRHRTGGNQTRRDRFDLDGCERLPRAIHHPGRQGFSRCSRSSQERESRKPEEGGHQSSSRNVSRSQSHGNVGDNARLNQNDRLPGSVVLARERLLQRLRGVALSENRESQAAMGRFVNSIETRPPGLGPQALKNLGIEAFHENDGQRLSRECSICLDSFVEGDELICLSCGHTYHFCCLDRWVSTCGDCPYCRRRIDVKTIF